MNYGYCKLHVCLGLYIQLNITLNSMDETASPRRSMNELNVFGWLDYVLLWLDVM